MSNLGINAASLPGNSKFSITELEWAQSIKPPFTSGFKKKGEPFTSEATVSENYNMSAQIVKYPVQGGYPLTDMAAVTSDNIIISAINSNSFLSPLAIVDSVKNSFLGGLFGGETQIQKTFRILSDYNRKGTPVSLSTVYAKEGYREEDGKALAPFIISNVTILRNTETGDSIGYTAMCERVFISQIAPIYKSDIQSKGKKSPVNPTDTSLKNKGPTFKAGANASDNFGPKTGGGWDAWLKSLSP